LWDGCVPSTVTWAKARETAKNLGGHLATIRSEGENRFLASLLAPSSTGWIGLYSPDGRTTVWITGEPVSYRPDQTQFFPAPWRASLVDAATWRAQLDPDMKRGFFVEWDH
jgi:hypothetical protein